jgi:plastocyanin
MLGASATERTVSVEDDQFVGGKVENGIPTFDALPGDTVKWRVEDTEHEHTVTPKNEPGYAAWPAEVKPSGTLNKGDEFKVLFANAGRYFYFCENHAAMKGVIDVKDQTPPPPPPSSSSSTTSSTTTSTTHTAPSVTTSTTAAPASSAGAKPPLTPAPAPTTTTAKDKKGKDDKKDETTTTTLPPPPPPVDLPDSAIIPVLPGSTGTTTQNGIEAPGDTPEGDAIALLKSKKGGGDKAMKLLIVSGLGLGALGLGTAGYKYANRSSKYFPA